MPTYSYLCTECAHDFDIHQSFTDDSLTVCPVCGGQLRKVFNSIGVTFNGPGFYRTDSRAAASDKLSAEKKPDGAASENKSSERKPSENKSERKPSQRQDSGTSSRKDSGAPKDSAKRTEKSQSALSGSAKSAG